MARSFDTIANINGVRDVWKVVVCITDIWKVVNNKQESHLEMVIMDVKIESYVINYLPFVIPSNITSHLLTIFMPFSNSTPSFKGIKSKLWFLKKRLIKGLTECERKWYANCKISVHNRMISSIKLAIMGTKFFSLPKRFYVN